MKLRIVLIGCLLMALTAPVAAAAGWKAGTARVVITPKEPMWMAGYAARNKPSEGKIHDLYAKAVALQDSAGTRLVIINAEVIGIRREDRDWLEQELSKQFTLKPEEFLVNVTHTHSGPEFRIDQSGLHVMPDDQVKKSLEYRKFLRQSLAEVAGKALRSMENAFLHFSSGRAGFAMNRRLKTDEGYIIAPNRTGPVDHQVPVLKISDGQGRIKALIFGYACHGTVMDFYEFCGDWPGFAQYEIEERFPGSTAMFLNGCSADQNPSPRRRLELAEQFGNSIANAVEAALLARQEPIEGPLQVRLEEAELNFENIPNLEKLQEMKASGDKYAVRRATALLKELEAGGSIPEKYSYLIQVAGFGNTLLLPALSGEVVVDYSLRLKNEIKGINVWVAGYSNDIMGYIPSKRVQDEGGYEGGEAIHYSTLPGTWGTDTEDIIISKVREIADSLRH